MSMKSGTFALSTAAAGNTQAITAIGFRPDWAIFLVTDKTVPEGDPDTIGNQSLSAAFGFDDLTERVAIGISPSNASDDRTGRAHTEADSIIVLDSTDVGGNGTIVGAAKVQTFDSDGFTILIDDAFAAAYDVFYLVGAGMGTPKMLRFTEPGATGNQSYTGFGFQPAGGLLFSANFASDPPGSISGPATMSMGAFDAAGRQGAVAFRNSNAPSPAVSQADKYGYTGECLAFLGDAIVDGRAAFNAILTDGVQLNWLERASTRRFWIVCWPETAADMHVSNFASPTVTGNTVAVSGLGFQPEGLFHFSHCGVTSTQDVAQGQALFSLGHATATTERGCWGISCRDGVDTNAVKGGFRDDELYFKPNISGVDSGGMNDLQSIDIDGYTVISDDEDPNASRIFTVAWKSTPLETRTRLVRYFHNTFVSRLAGRPIVHDVQGRDIPLEQLETDHWLYGDGPFFPSSSQGASLITEPRAQYIEGISRRGEEAEIVTSKESLLESLLRRLSRSG